MTHAAILAAHKSNGDGENVCIVFEDNFQWKAPVVKVQKVLQDFFRHFSGPRESE